MKVAYLIGQNIPLEIKEIELPALTTGKVLIKLHYAALNHRDVWIKKGQYKGSSEGLILGSDGAGIIEAFSEDVKDMERGQEVVINPGLDWGPNVAAQKKDFRILGNPDPGTFAEYIIIDSEQVFPKPKHLSLKEAAALPLAGLTAYRALFTRGKIQKNQDVLITGIGGGVAQFLLQFSVTAGAKVYVTSGNDDKLQEAKSNGAIDGFNYKEKNWVEKIKQEIPKGFDLIIDSAVGEGFINLIEMTKSGGTIVFYGGTAGPIPKIIPAKIFWRQLNILGTTMGTPAEFAAMLHYYETHLLKPTIDSVFSLNKINEAMDRMDKGAQTGKILLKM